MNNDSRLLGAEIYRCRWLPRSKGQAKGVAGEEAIWVDHKSFLLSRRPRMKVHCGFEVYWIRNWDHQKGCSHRSGVGERCLGHKKQFRAINVESMLEDIPQIPDFSLLSTLKWPLMNLPDDWAFSRPSLGICSVLAVRLNYHLHGPLPDYHNSKSPPKVSLHFSFPDCF